MSKNIPGAFLKWTAYACLTVAVCFAAVEASMRLGLIRPAFHYMFDLGFTITLDDELLYRVTPHSSPEINGQGYRDGEFGPRREGVKRVLFLGDSFVMGMTTPPDRTIPAELERTLGGRAEVLNMGVFGYGPDQSLVQLLEDGIGLGPDLVVLSIFPPNDFEDIIKNRIFTLGPDGALLRSRANIVEATLPRVRSLYLLDYLLYKYRARAAYFGGLFIALHKDSPDIDLYFDRAGDAQRTKTALMRLVLRRFKAELGKRGVPFLVVIIPSGPDMDKIYYSRLKLRPHLYEDIASEMLAEEGIPYINLSPELLRGGGRPFYVTIPEQGGEHLNALGHRKAAETIAAYVRVKNRL